ncbi:MAG: lysozyme [Zoogloea sp.]|uniref:lysozyme n=1 Tax=Zoogloea sp. TaxID=49181 RepID=UPI003F35A145
MRTINAAGLALIKQSEGLRLDAYPDVVNVWTIGYGHTGPDVHPGLTITQAQAEQLLKQDLARFEQGVSQLVRVSLNDNQFAALVSFSYNLGLGNLRNSTLLRLLNQGDYAGAALQFPRWNRAGGHVVQGLVTRRKQEQALFNTLPVCAAEDEFHPLSVDEPPEPPELPESEAHLPSAPPPSHAAPPDMLVHALHELHEHASQVLGSHLHEWVGALERGEIHPHGHFLPSIAQALHTVRGALAPFLHPNQDGPGHG